MKKSVQPPSAPLDVVPVKAAQLDSLHAAQGKVQLLAIGINDYEASSGFHPLKVCVSDATTVRNRFLDIEQLNADKPRCMACTSKSTRQPSRGEILRLLHQLANQADSSNRIIFYFSGHGHRIGERFYLVPQDAFASDEPSALIAFEDVLTILNESEAKQKFVILDACLSGPDTTHLKALPAQLSIKFLKEYLASTTGTAILCSCGIDEESTTLSPNPKLSLFTHYLCESLAGHKDTLDAGRLTLQSLYAYLSVEVRQRAKSYQHKQNPALTNTMQGVMILADFTKSLLESSALDLEQYPVVGLDFVDTEPAEVSDVLTEIKRWTAYSEEYLEKVVNANLGSYFSDRLGRFAAELSNRLGIPVGEISVEDAALQFPGGSYWITYERHDKKSGIFQHTVSFGSEWFDRPERMVELLGCLDMQPKRLTVELQGKRSLESMVAGVLAKGWLLESQKLPKEFSARNGPYRIRCTPSRIHFEGFLPAEILGSEAEPEKQSWLVWGICG
jgi:Caspase domain